MCWDDRANMPKVVNGQKDLFSDNLLVRERVHECIRRYSRGGLYPSNFGPAATQVLADHGAEVIKIERPGQGDLARAFGPWHNGQSMPFASLNLSKESLVVDLKKSAGLAVVHRLLEKARRACAQLSFRQRDGKVRSGLRRRSRSVTRV